MDLSISLYLIFPIIFILILVIFITGFVVLVDEFDNCSNTNLWLYNLCSYLTFITNIIFFIKNWFFYFESRIESYQKKRNLVFHNILQLTNFGLMMWGIVEIAKNECSSSLLWNFGIINITFQLISVLLLLFVILQIKNRHRIIETTEI